MTGSLRVAALPHGHDAQVAQRANRARAVTLRAVQVQGLLELADGLRVAALQAMDDAQTAPCAGHATDVVGLAGQRLRPLVVPGCILVAALPYSDDAEADQRSCFRGAVSDLASCAACVAVQADCLGEMATSIEVPQQDIGHSDGMAWPAVFGHVLHGRKQAGPFGIQPCQCLSWATDRPGGDRGLCSDQAHRVERRSFGRVQNGHRRGGGMQVVVE